MAIGGTAPDLRTITTMVPVVVSSPSDTVSSTSLRPADLPTSVKVTVPSGVKVTSSSPLTLASTRIRSSPSSSVHSSSARLLPSPPSASIIGSVCFFGCGGVFTDCWSPSTATEASAVSSPPRPSETV